MKNTPGRSGWRSSSGGLDHWQLPVRYPVRVSLKCSQYKNKYRRLSLNSTQGSHECPVMLSARQLGIARPRFIKSSEIMSRQTTVDSLLLPVAAGQPSDSIAIVCSNESTFLAKSTIAYCMHWQMSNVSPQTVIAARTIFIVNWLGFGRTLNMACTDHFTTLPSVT